MRGKLPVYLSFLALAALAGCGSSGPSEAEAVRLLNERASISSARCAKTQGREFVCQANVEGEGAVLHATVAEDGQTIVVSDCKQKEPYGDGEVPCEVP
jgi:GAF domain-containing protein